MFVIELMNVTKTSAIMLVNRWSANILCEVLKHCGRERISQHNPPVCRSGGSTTSTTTTAATTTTATTTTNTTTTTSTTRADRVVP